MQREGVFREMKLRGHYEKPSEKRVREKAEAIRRARKLARKKLQREGLLPMKPRVIPGPREEAAPRARPASDLRSRHAVVPLSKDRCKTWAAMQTWAQKSRSRKPNDCVWQLRQSRDARQRRARPQCWQADAGHARRQAQ